MNPVTGSIVSNLGGAIIGGISSAITNNQNVAAQERINRQQLDFAREQTEREFDYNSLSSQMKRAMEAGVNPYLLAGAQPTSANAQSTPSIDAPIRQNPFANVPQNAMNIGNNLIAAEQLSLREKEIQVQKQATDIQAFNQKVQIFKTLLDTLGTKDLTSTEVQDIMKQVFSNDAMNVTLPDIIRDNYVSTEILNKIETSNLSMEEKRIYNSMYSSFIQLQYLLMQNDAALKESQEKLNNALKDETNAKIKEINQAIKNMEEEWKTLNFEGELSQEKLKHISTLANSIVDKLVAETNVTQNEAQYWVWKTLLENPQQANVGIFGLKFGFKGGYVGVPKSDQQGTTVPRTILHPLE